LKRRSVMAAATIGPSTDRLDCQAFASSVTLLKHKGMRLLVTKSMSRTCHFGQPAASAPLTSAALRRQSAGCAAYISPR